MQFPRVRVVRCCGDAAVTKYLGHLGKRCTSPEHRRPRGVAEAVRAEAPEPGPLARRPHDLAHPLRAEAVKRGGHPQENLPLRALRAILPQVGGERLAHVRGQWQTFFGTPLAADHYLARPPVNVVETERCHFCGAQPEARQKDQDGVVASAYRTPPVAARQ